MLVIPLTGKIDWKKNPPIITLSLILMNCLIYFAFQLDDTKEYMAAVNYYMESGLAEIEFPEYEKYLEKQGEPVKTDNDNPFQTYGRKQYLYRKLHADTDFLEKLRNNQIITPEQESYASWKEMRTSFEDKRDSITIYRYGYIPSQNRPLTWLTYMFLHGGMGHLLGNMVFLWIVGCALELGCNRIIYLLAYLATGVISVWLFGMVHSASTGPLVGASGAISGLMGLFSILFGTKRIKIFLSLGFYFTTVLVPAIVLLPFWIAKELVQFYMYAQISNVAYMAHAGGLIGGGAVGYLMLKIPNAVNREELKSPEEEERIPKLMAGAQEKIQELDFEGAKVILEQVLEEEPENREALLRLYNIEKKDINSPDFHRITERILTIFCKKTETYPQAFNMYREYEKTSPAGRLSPVLYIRLSLIFTGLGQLEASGRIVSLMVKKNKNYPGLTTAILKLGSAYQARGNHSNWEKCRKVLLNRFPDSPEARIIKDRES